jgi:hypothetical protein
MTRIIVPTAATTQMMILNSFLNFLIGYSAIFIHTALIKQLPKTESESDNVFAYLSPLILDLGVFAT